MLITLCSLAYPYARGATPSPDPHRHMGLLWSGSYRRREPLSGLVTLALLAVLAAFVVTRIMRRIGLSMSRSNTFGFIFFFVVVVLMVWGQSTNGK
jgi:hypothetical protein